MPLRLIKAPRTILSAKQRVPQSKLRRPRVSEIITCDKKTVKLNTARDIIMPEDIPFVNRFGTKQLLPDGSRQPLAEMRRIAQIVVSVNGMSTFSPE